MDPFSWVHEFEEIPPSSRKWVRAWMYALVGVCVWGGGRWAPFTVHSYYFTRIWFRGGTFPTNFPAFYHFNVLTLHSIYYIVSTTHLSTQLIKVGFKFQTLSQLNCGWWLTEECGVRLRIFHYTHTHPCHTYTYVNYCFWQIAVIKFNV